MSVLLLHRVSLAGMGGRRGVNHASHGKGENIVMFFSVNGAGVCLMADAGTQGYDFGNANDPDRDEVRAGRDNIDF